MVWKTLSKHKMVMKKSYNHGMEKPNTNAMEKPNTNALEKPNTKCVSILGHDSLKFALK